jgi:hypothetical protein
MASADTGEREMETYRTEQPGGSATVAAGPGDDDVEQMRQQILRAPTATEKAKADEDRRRFNAKAHGPEIAACQQRLATFRENNERLAKVGLAVANFPTPPDLRDLTFSELKALLALLGRLLSEQAQTLDRHRAQAAEAQWQAELALETPIVRMLLERLEAVEAEFAELKAERSGRDRAIARAAPVRPKASMSNMGVALGDGLTPALSIPVAPPGTSPRRIPR